MNFFPLWELLVLPSICFLLPAKPFVPSFFGFSNRIFNRNKNKIEKDKHKVFFSSSFPKLNKLNKRPIFHTSFFHLRNSCCYIILTSTWSDGWCDEEFIRNKNRNAPELFSFLLTKLNLNVSTPTQEGNFGSGHIFWNRFVLFF